MIPPDWPVFDRTIAWEAAQAALDAQGLGDGLPLVPPTTARLGAMLGGIAAPDKSYGLVPPLFGELSPAAVAYNALLAGARPGEVAVVLSAIEAALAPAFNLLGVQTTTGTPALAVIVHGALAAALGVSSGGNCLGPGNRANACIGRAVALCLRNIGGARAGTGDMATMGQPGKYTFCFAEDANGPFASLPRRRGLDAGTGLGAGLDTGAITVLATTGTVEILPEEAHRSPQTILRPVARAMRAAIATSGALSREPRAEQVLLLPPELAGRIDAAGWDLARVQAYLFETGASNETGAIARAPDDVLVIVAGGPGVKMTYLPAWAGGSFSQTTLPRALS